MLVNPLYDERAYTQEQARELASMWGWILALGILTIVAGILILAIPWTITGLAVFIGAVLIVRGIVQLFNRPVNGGSRAGNIIFGALSVLVGVAALAVPVRTLEFLGILLGAWLVVSGVYDIVASIATRRTAHAWWVALVRGIIAVPLGIVALSRPLAALAVLVAVLGIWAIVVGVTEIIAAFEVRRLPRLLAQRQPMTAEEIAIMMQSGETPRSGDEGRTKRP
jgi:uncharacterized membrane protein HdeD (DUF308 family)